MTVIDIRRWHSYVGLFTAPSILFFALTGAVQLYNLHEAHGSYQPPVILEKLSSVHKDQVFALGHHQDEPAVGTAAAPTDASAAASADAGATPGAPVDDDKATLSTTLLKGFFLLVALSLTLSTCLGLWIGLTQSRRQRTSWCLLIAGALIPLGLLLV